MISDRIPLLTWKLTTEKSKSRWCLLFYYIHFKNTGEPCNLIGSHRYDLFKSSTIFGFKSYLFNSQGESFTLKNNRSDF